MIKTFKIFFSPRKFTAITVLFILIFAQFYIPAFVKKAEAATAYVQGGANQSSFGGTTVAVTLNGVTAGNVLAVFVFWASAANTLSSITSAGVSGGFTIVENPTTGNLLRGAGAYGVITSSGNITITATLSAGAGYASIAVHELSGVDTSTPLEDSVGNAQTDPGTATDAVTSGNLVTTTNGAIISVASRPRDSGIATMAAGTGFTDRNFLANVVYSETAVRASAGTAPATFTVSYAFADPVTIGMAFKASASDITAPVRSGGSPSNSLVSGTTQTDISLTTDEQATCKYSTTAGTAYDSMAGSMTATNGGMTHTANVSVLDGHIYNYYVRCRDVASSPNTNLNDYTINFSVIDVGTVYAETCSAADVQTAIDASITGTGDTVSIPAGTCSWNSTVTVNKSITISGQTTTSRNATTYQVVPTDTTIIQKNGFNVTATNDVRITGITFDGNVSGAATQPIVLPQSPVNMRIDHNHFSHYARTWNKGSGGGYLNVLFDHNRITQPGEENLYIVGAGNQSWIDAGTCGSANPEKTTWFEDNEWILETASVSNPIDSGEGARVVLRNNRFSGTANYSFQLVSEAHGHFWGQRDGVDNAGAYCFESSGNKIFKTQSIGNNGEVVLKTRAGKNYVYNNSLSTALANAWGTFIQYWVQEADLGYATSGGDGAETGEHGSMGIHNFPWGLPQWDGTHCVVYPCPMQPNNSYSWGNTWDNGTPSVIVQGTGTSDFMQEDRDYWDDIGTGDTNFSSGLSTARPATCTTDNNYWETDNNKLYRCESTDTWVSEYTAYTYPHPLTVSTDTDLPIVNTYSPADNSSDVAINSNLVIVFNENVAKGTGNILIKKSSDDSTVQTINVTSGTVVVNGTSVTINPSNLDYNTGYYVNIASGVFTDTATTPNAYTGISNATTWNFTTATAPDVIAPVRSVGSPSGSQQSGTTQVTLSLTTDENATCKYGTTASTAYASIANTFTTTGAISHSATISGLSNGSSYNYYVRCTDGSNVNSDDYTISFSVASPASSGGGGSPAMWTLPTVPPNGFKININNGALSTSNRNVLLGFSAGTDIKKIAISMTGDFTDASQEDYTPTKQLDLCSKFGGLIKNTTCPNGTYKVYAQFYTAYGRSSNAAVASSSITLTNGITNTTTPALVKYNFTRNLSLHATGADVKLLQQYLNANGFVIAKTGAGSSGKETTLFGTLTYKALVKFQKSLGWSGTGFFGPMTRDYINKQ